MRTLSFAALILFAGVLVFQVFVHPVIGLADNGDWSKVYGHFCMVAAGHGDSGSANYYITDWRVDLSKCHTPPIITCERFLLQVAVTLSRVLTRARDFDIRWLGAVHMLLYAAGFLAVLLVAAELPRRARLAAICILGLTAIDVAYTAYLPTFYGDAAAIATIFGVLATTLHYAISGRLSPAFWIFAMLLLTSKSQHAPLGFLLAAFILLVARVKRLPWPDAVLQAAVCAGTALYMLYTLPEDYRADPFFSTVFFEIAGRSSNPKEELAALGLGAQHEVAVGLYAYQDKWPANDVPWKIATFKQSGFLRLAAYYIRNPGRAVSIIGAAISEYGRDVRPLLLANYRQEDGFPPGSQTRAFSWWSNVRRTVYSNHAAPYFVLALYAGLAAVSTAFLFKPGTTRGIGLWMILLCSAGIAELVIATLFDVLETSRHLLLFHLITDVVICAVVAAVAVSASSSRRYS